MSVELGYRPTIIQTENNIGGESLDTLPLYKDTSYLLEGTGLPIRSETDNLEKLLYENIGEKPYLSIINEWLTNTGENFFHFSREHMLSRPLLGFIYAIKKDNGVDRLKAPKYSDAIIANISSFGERYGSQKRAIIGDPSTGDEGFEAFLIRAPIGSIVARTSPPGWSGYPGYTYKEAQTQLMIKVEEDDEVKIKGYNIRTMTDVDQSEAFLRELGISDQRIGTWGSWQEKERLANVTGINIYFPADSNPTTIEELADKFFKISGESIFNNYTIQDVKKDMQRFDELINMDVEASERMDKIKEYTIQELMRVREEVITTKHIPTESLTNLQKVYGTMVLDFWMKIKHGSQPVRVDDINVSTRSYSDNVVVGYGGDRYRNALTELQAATGCPGVSSKSDDPFQNPALVFLENPFGAILAEFNPLENFTGSCKKIKCGREGCGWEPNESQAKEVGKSITKCPDCGWKPGDSKKPLININPEVKQDKMTLFENKEDDYKQSANKIINRAELNKKPDNKNTFSITLFQGPLSSLQQKQEEAKHI